MGNFSNTQTWCRSVVKIRCRVVSWKITYSSIRTQTRRFNERLERRKPPLCGRKGLQVTYYVKRRSAFNTIPILGQLEIEATPRHATPEGRFSHFRDHMTV